MKFELVYRHKYPTARACGLGIHPEHAVGARADANDIIVFPLTEGIVSVPYQAGRHKAVSPASGWFGAVDTYRKEMVIYTFPLGRVQPRIYMGPDYYNLELAIPKRNIKTPPGRSIGFSFSMFLLHGLSRIDAFGHGVAITCNAYIEKLEGRQELDFQVAATSARQMDAVLEVIFRSNKTGPKPILRQPVSLRSGKVLRASGKSYLQSRRWDQVILDGAKEKAEIALLWSETSKRHQVESFSAESVVWNAMDGFAFLLRDIRVPYDAVADEDLRAKRIRQYKIVVLPCAQFLPEQAIKALKAYVNAGGTLLLTGQAASRELYGAPNISLLSCAGVVPIPAKQPVVVGIGGPYRIRTKLKARAFRILFDDAEILARYADGLPAVLRVRVGKGNIILVGFHLGLDYSAFGPVKSRGQGRPLRLLIRRILRSLRIEPIAVCEDLEVEVQSRIYRGRGYLLLANLSIARPKSVTIRIRGSHRIFDYVISREMESSRQNGFTAFVARLLKGGGRVYKVR